MKAIPGFPNYFASRKGEIFSRQPIGSGRWWRRRYGPLHKLNPIQDGKYLYVNLCVERIHKKVAVHALVLLTFRGPRKTNQEARHLNGDGHDNKLQNLLWGTAKENADDRERHGKTVRGSRCNFWKGGITKHPDYRKMYRAARRLQ